MAPIAHLFRRLTRTLTGRSTRLELVIGDITQQTTDAIVNAAKPSLLGGGGVDGAIHAAAGPNLLATCRKIRATTHPDGLLTGDAIVTGAFRLPAQFVIHTVGPVYRNAPYASLLRSCYTSSLQAADEVGARTVAFPLISSGVYGWPVDDAIRQAVRAIRNTNTRVRLVRLVVFDAQTYDLARDIINEERF